MVFLQYTDGKGNKNGTIYQEDRAEGDQFFWDFTSTAAADYFLASVLASASHPAVDGTFTDDVTGAPARDSTCQHDRHAGRGAGSGHVVHPPAAGRRAHCRRQVQLAGVLWQQALTHTP